MLRNICLIIIILALGLFSNLCANTQGHREFSPEDSLIRVEVVKIIIHANVHNRKGDFKEAFKGYDKADSISLSMDDFFLLASSKYNRGLCYYRMGDYIKYRDLLEKAIILSKKSGEGEANAQYVLGLGILYKKQGDYDNAVKFILRSLSGLEQKGDLNNMASAYTALAGIQKELINDSLAIKYYQKSLGIYKSLNDSIGISSLFNNIGFFYTKRAVFDSAIIYLRGAKVYKENLKNKSSLITTLNNLGDVYYNLNQFDSAHYYYQLSYKNAIESKNELNTVSVSNSLAELYINEKNYPEALEYLSKAQPVAELNLANKILLENYRLSSLVYSKTDNYENAFLYSKKYIELNNQIFDQEKTKGINELHFQYDTEKKDLTIKNLNEINVVKSQSLKTRNRSLIVISSFLILLIILSIFLYSAFKAKRNALDQVQLLMREKQHRTKNNLQLLSSVLSLQSLKADGETKQMAMAGEHRVQSIVLLDKLLSNEKEGDKIEITAYIQNLIEGLKEAYDHQNRIVFDLQLDSFLLAAHQATHLGLIINELITNSLKYAFDDHDNPKIIVLCKKDNSGFCNLTIKDNGPGIIKAFNLSKTTSLGLKLVKSMSKQLKGVFNIKGDDGFEFNMHFKLKS